MIPTYEQIKLPLLKVLATGTFDMNQLVDKMAAAFSLTPEELAKTVKSGRHNMFKTRVYWSKLYMKQAGLVSYPERGKATITERGKSVLAENPPSISNEYLMRFDEFRDFFQRTGSKNSNKNSTVNSSENIDIENSTPKERIEQAIQELNSLLAQTILERLVDMDPTAFEHVLLDLFKAMGYGRKEDTSIRHLGGASDEGVDGVIDADPLGIEQVYIQAKRYKRDNKINPKQMREFSGSLSQQKSSKGIFVTTSDYTDEARLGAEKSDKKIVLINGIELADLMVEYGVGCRPPESYIVREIDEDYFSE